MKTGKPINIGGGPLISPSEKGKTGWICPKCGKSVAPDLETCKSKVCSENQMQEFYNTFDTMFYNKVLLNEGN